VVGGLVVLLLVISLIRRRRSQGMAGKQPINVTVKKEFSDLATVSESVSKMPAANPGDSGIKQPVDARVDMSAAQTPQKGGKVPVPASSSTATPAPRNAAASWLEVNEVNMFSPTTPGYTPAATCGPNP